jgi:hypothetical protein
MGTPTTLGMTTTMPFDRNIAPCNKYEGRELYLNHPAQRVKDTCVVLVTETTRWTNLYYMCYE